MIREFYSEDLKLEYINRSLNNIQAYIIGNEISKYKINDIIHVVFRGCIYKCIITITYDINKNYARCNIIRECTTLATSENIRNIKLQLIENEFCDR